MKARNRRTIYEIQRWILSLKSLSVKENARGIMGGDPARLNDRVLIRVGVDTLDDFDGLAKAFNIAMVDEPEGSLEANFQNFMNFYIYQLLNS